MIEDKVVGRLETEVRDRPMTEGVNGDEEVIVVHVEEEVSDKGVEGFERFDLEHTGTAVPFRT